MKNLLLLTFSVVALIFGFPQESLNQTESRLTIRVANDGTGETDPDSVRPTAPESDQAARSKTLAEADLTGGFSEGDQLHLTNAGRLVEERDLQLVSSPAAS